MIQEGGRCELGSVGLQACWQGINCGYLLHHYMQNDSEHLLVCGLQIQQLLESDADHSPSFSVKVNTVIGFMDINHPPNFIKVTFQKPDSASILR